MEIKDSGERQEFNTGAVRDISEGKGRCDLLPLDVISDLFTGADAITGKILKQINWFVRRGDPEYLRQALHIFSAASYRNVECLILEVSEHFEAGCKKYGERNWEKGIPLHCYIDSAVRHLLKFSDGYEDEYHDRAFAWNLLCAIWTLENKPELNDLPCAGK